MLEYLPSTNKLLCYSALHGAPCSEAWPLLDAAYGERTASNWQASGVNIPQSLPKSSGQQTGLICSICGAGHLL